MPYIAVEQLDKLRMSGRKTSLHYCASCQVETGHLMPRFFRFGLTSINASRLCLACGWYHTHKPVKNKKLRRAVLEADGHECVYCGETRRLGLDHVVPQIRGGKSTFDNLLTACHWCNRQKGEGLNALTPRFGRYRQKG